MCSPTAYAKPANNSGIHSLSEPGGRIFTKQVCSQFSWELVVWGRVVDVPWCYSTGMSLHWHGLFKGCSPSGKRAALWSPPRAWCASESPAMSLSQSFPHSVPSARPPPSPQVSPQPFTPQGPSFPLPSLKRVLPGRPQSCRSEPVRTGEGRSVGRCLPSLPHDTLQPRHPKRCCLDPK